MKKIKLSQGKWALVDDEDFERVNQYKWCTEFSRNTYYAKCSNVKIKGKKKTLRLHQFVAGYFGGPLKVDHVNGKGWDCQKKNLRVVTEQHNSANRAPYKGCASKYKGVTWDKARKKWRATLAKKHIGYYRTQKEAGLAYDLAALNRFGQHSRLNFPGHWQIELTGLAQGAVESDVCEAARAAATQLHQGL